MEAVKKEDTLRKLWIEAKRGVEMAEVKQEQYRLRKYNKLLRLDKPLLSIYSGCMHVACFRI